MDAGDDQEPIGDDSVDINVNPARGLTHMEWALEARPGVDALLEYEARANLVAFTFQ